jgi:serine/threonine protein kinase
MSSRFTSSWLILEQLFSALQFAHDLGVNHGHLHPGNLLIDDKNQLHITGFSLPVAMPRRGSAYLSQDARSGQFADVADDIYSLGCILFTLLTDRPWHQDESFQANSPIPLEVQQTVAAMLNPSPYERPTNLRESKEILANYAQGVSGAKPIEIPESTFRRAGPLSTGQIRTADVHRLPRERNLVSSKMVAGGLAVLLILAAFVFFILPGSRTASDTTYEVAPAAEPHAPQDSPKEQSTEPEPAQLGPHEIAELAFLEEEGKRIASLLLRKQVELEDQGALLWGADRYAQINEQADSGDALYREESYQAAIDAYESAIEQLEVLQDTIPSILENNLAEGEAAILEGNVEAAISAWTIASAIDPGNREYNVQLLRAENLEQVLTYMKDGEFQEREMVLKDALRSFRDAARLDPDWDPARKAVNRVGLKIAKTKFADAMSAGFSALAAGQYEDSRQAFARAQKIFPNSTEPIDGILQIDLAERMDTINAHRDAAAEFFRQEDWPLVIAEYDAVLALDTTLVFATTGIEDARKRLEISGILDRFLQQPTLMQNESEFSAAKTALVSASRIRPPGAHLKSQLSTLSRLITVARIPIVVELTSDNKTEVTIYKVRKFGKLNSAEVELFPGDYTIVGKRRGYRDVQHQLTLLAGEPISPVFISCVEKI